MDEKEENIIVIRGKKYDLNKLSNEEILKLHEYIVKRGNSIIKKIKQMDSENPKDEKGDYELEQ